MRWRATASRSRTTSRTRCRAPARGSARWPASAKIFLKADGNALAPGDLLVQRDLADTLEAIAKHGPRAFYEGPIAEKLAAAVQAAGGIMTADDLKNYQPHVRRPVRGRYRGHEIISMPPSSSGGVVLIEMLNVLEGYKLNEQDDASRLHLMIEAMRRAYADRAAYLGDPAVVSAPLVRLMSKRYAAQLRSGINPERATPSHEIRSDIQLPREGDNTTHFSVVDRYGNAVANTYTLNFSYGVGLVADGTGVLLNNELDDFAARPATPNAFGLIGGEANAPGPNKRPLSSMTPTIVTKNGRPVIVTGSPGGSRIITSVLQVIVNVIDRNMDAFDAVSAPRIHHQWSPDRVIVEQGLPDRGDHRAGRPRPQDGPAPLWRHVGEHDPGDAEGLRRRRRSAHARVIGGGVLSSIIAARTLSSTLPLVGRVDR